MAVASSGFAGWPERLRQASEAVRREVFWLASDVNGPSARPLRLAASDVWGGPFADQLRDAIRFLDRQLVPWADHLARLHTALDQASTEVEAAIRAEASGIPSTYDLFGALAQWRRWPVPSLPLSPGWAASGPRGSATFVWVYPDRARQLASELRVTAEELRAARRRLTSALSPLGIDAPPGLDAIAGAAEEIAGEVVRRVEALEEADRRTAGTFATVGEQLGFPGSLAPPAGFDPAELRNLAAPARPRADVGPGRQRTQAKEADPVSTSTGNYLHEFVDLFQAGRGLPTVFARTYNSLRATEDGPLGFGWSHDLATHLVIDPGGATVMWGDGHEERHTRAASGELIAPGGVHDRLRHWHGRCGLQRSRRGHKNRGLGRWRCRCGRGMHRVWCLILRLRRRGGGQCRVQCPGVRAGSRPGSSRTCERGRRLCQLHLPALPRRQLRSSRENEEIVPGPTLIVAGIIAILLGAFRYVSASSANGSQRTPFQRGDMIGGAILAAVGVLLVVSGLVATVVDLLST